MALADIQWNSTGSGDGPDPIPAQVQADGIGEQDGQPVGWLNRWRAAVYDYLANTVAMTVADFGVEHYSTPHGSAGQHKTINADNVRTRRGLAAGAALPVGAQVAATGWTRPSTSAFDTTEQELHTLTIPQGTINSIGDMLDIRACGHPNGNLTGTMTLRIRIGPASTALTSRTKLLEHVVATPLQYEQDHLSGDVLYVKDGTPAHYMEMCGRYLGAAGGNTFGAAVITTLDPSADDIVVSVTAQHGASEANSYANKYLEVALR